MQWLGIATVKDESMTMQPYCAHCKTNDHWGEDCLVKHPNGPAEKPKPFKHCATCTCTVTKPAKFDKGVTKSVGRPRLHQSNAEKQKSYRERQKK